MRASTSAPRQAVELAATVVVLAAAAASGAELFAYAAEGTYSFHDLLLTVGLPAVGVVVLLTAVGAVAGWRRLSRGVLLGAWTGLVGTVGLEVVRNIGFRVFDTMPGDLPRLMGVYALDRIMSGPNLASDVVGFADHFYNGAAFGVIYVLLAGGFPRRYGVWAGGALGLVYGLLLGTGFLDSQVSVITGAGHFGSLIGQKYAITVYLAHAAFGLILGLLVHRYGHHIDPLWTPAWRLTCRLAGRPTPGTAGTGTAGP